MPDHVITVRAGYLGTSIRVYCTCTEGMPIASRPGSLVLVELTEIAHRHIETADRDWEYGAKSAATTEGALSPES